jgi:enterochelin esterase-like enzyme
MKKQHLLTWLSSLVIASFGLGYWYVFIAGAPQLDAEPAEINTGLTFQLASYNSPIFGQRRIYGIVLPPNYAKQAHRHYPVVFLLHGGHGGPRDWQDKGALTSVLHDLYREKRLVPVIVITPDGNDQRGSSPFYDPQYYDGPKGKVATAIAVELVQVVKSRYRTLDKPQFWAMGGLSSGGWGALNIGLRHLNQFQALFSHSGYFTDSSGVENSPAVFIRSLSPARLRGLRVYLDAGENDGKFLKSTQQFQQILTQLGVTHQVNVFPGGHGIVGPDAGWNYWRQHLADSLTYIGQQFKS